MAKNQCLASIIANVSYRISIEFHQNSGNRLCRPHHTRMHARTHARTHTNTNTLRRFTRAARQLLVHNCKACHLNTVNRRYTNAADCLSAVIAFLEDLVNSVIDRCSQRMPCSWIYPKLAAGPAVGLWKLRSSSRNELTGLKQ